MTFKSIIDEIENNLKKILSDLSIIDVAFSVEPAKPGFGDVSSNVSLISSNSFFVYVDHISILFEIGNIQVDFIQIALDFGSI